MMTHIDKAIPRREKVKRLMILAAQDKNMVGAWRAQHLLNRIDEAIQAHFSTAKNIFKA